MPLYLVATPIGNLADITLRALETLRSCDYILCEDTRHSAVLLKHYDIAKPLKSYHKFNEAKRTAELITDLQQGLSIALISDAGTPGIADPGAWLIERSIAEGVPIIALPGPCAAVAALSCSGLPTDQWQYVGFLPAGKETLKKRLVELLSYPGTTICYETPHRLLGVLGLLNKAAPRRQLVIARELTKRFEQLQRGTAAELYAYWSITPCRGEIVLMLAGITPEEEALAWSHLTPQEQVAQLQELFALTQTEAIKLVAQRLGFTKRALYQAFHLGSGPLKG